jgi:hypothetical protein
LTQINALSAIRATMCQQSGENGAQRFTIRSTPFKESTMRRALITFGHLKLVRAAAVIALGTIACAGLSACGPNQAGAVSGSSAQNVSNPCPNQPDYSDINYHCP